MPDKILRLDAVIELTGLQRSTIYDLVRAGDFPEQYRLSPGAVGWKESEIEAWINSRTRMAPKQD